MTRKVMVNGSVFDMSAKEAALNLNINYSTLLTRIKSDSPKYSQWKYFNEKPSIIINGKNYKDINDAIFELAKIQKDLNAIKK